MGSIKASKGQPKAALVWRTGLSGAPPGSVRCTRELDAQLFTFRNFQRSSAIIHRTVSGAPRKSDSELASFGNPLRYNSPDCPVSHRTVSGAHRTVRCDSGATTTSRQRSPTEAFDARQRAQRSRARAGGTPDSLQGMSGGAPDMPCRLSGVPPARALLLCALWRALNASAGDRWREVAVSPLSHRTVQCAPDTVR